MPVLTNARHERFAQEIAKGMKPGAYYVYVLVDPRDGEPFYVGKGKGQRFRAHVREWRANQVLNARKFSRIGEIIEGGRQVVPVKLIEGVSEADAFRGERLVIESIGRHALTNIVPGQRTSIEKAVEVAKGWLRRVKPLDEWVNERRPTAYEVGLYHRIVASLTTTAALQ